MEENIIDNIKETKEKSEENNIQDNTESKEENKVNYGSYSYSTLNNFLNTYSIPQIMCNYLDNIVIDTIIVDILCPLDKNIIYSKDETNTNSIVALISLKNKKNYLFMGDATVETEKIIINNIDSLQDASLKNYYTSKLNNIYSIQIGHHGSKTSTSNELLNYINVKYAVLSAKKSMYGHPSINIVEKLIVHDIKYFLTEKNGGMYIK